MILQGNPPKFEYKLYNCSKASLIMCVYLISYTKAASLVCSSLQKWVKYFTPIGCMLFSRLILDEFGTFPNICLLVASIYLCMIDYPLKLKAFLLIQDGSFPHNVMIMKL